MLDLEQAICNAQFLLGTMSTALCQELEYGNAPCGGDAASGTSDTVCAAQKELHRSFHAFHASWGSDQTTGSGCFVPQGAREEIKAPVEQLDQPGTNEKTARFLPPERQIHSTIPLELAMWQAIGIIELLSSRLDRELRETCNGNGIAGQWIAGQSSLSMDIAENLHKLTYEHFDEVHRLQRLGLDRAG